MTTKTLIAAAAVAALFAHGASVAQEATPGVFADAVSTASRDAVRAEAVAALRAGQIAYGEAPRFDVPAVSLKSRDQVRAEAIEARRLGLTGSGEVTAPAATPAQAEAIRQAGLRAVSTPVAATAR